MCGMPPSVRRIVAENPVAPAGAGTAPASSAIVALATTAGAITRGWPNPHCLPLSGRLFVDGRTRGTIPRGGRFVQSAERWREAVDGELSRRIRALGGAAPLGRPGALQHRGR